MLTLTETATTVVKSIVDRDPNVADGAVRIGRGATDRDFAIAVVDAPQPGDDVVESDGARVYLEPAVSLVLEDKTLDAHVTETGAVTFALVSQS